MNAILRRDRMPPTLPRMAALLLCLLAGLATSAVLFADVTNTGTSVRAWRATKLALPETRPQERWSLLAAGDIMLSRGVERAMEKAGSVHFPFDGIRDIVRSADLAFANLENPVAPGRPVAPHGMVFRADPDTLEGLRDAGFDMVSLANNHMTDAGTANVTTTRRLLAEAGIAAAGAGATEAEARAPVFFTIRGKRIALLAYGDDRFKKQVRFATEKDPGIARASSGAFARDIAAARAQADLVFVSLHAGAEYRAQADALQRTLLDAAADAGADLVLGHHPHVVQPLAKRGNAWIIESLGNAVFDQMWSEDTKRGMFLRFTFEGIRLAEIEAISIDHPVMGQPLVSQGSIRAATLERLRAPLARATVLAWGGSGTGMTLAERAMPLQDPPPGATRIARTLGDNQNGNRLREAYDLRDGRLAIIENGLTLWTSPDDWWIDDIALADIDGDRSREVIVSLWTAPGRDGSRNAIASLHWTAEGLRPGWSSGPLPAPVCAFRAADLDADARDELLAIEGAFVEDGTCTGNKLALLTFGGTGWHRAWESAPGRFWNLRTEDSGSGSVVVVNGGVGM